MVRAYTFTYLITTNTHFVQQPLSQAMKLFYTKLKKLTCININSKCRECPLTTKCIYHYLSGENFMEFPSVIIQRSLFEPKVFNKNELLIIRLFLLDVTFENYVIRFFEELTHIENTDLIFKHKEVDHIDLTHYQSGSFLIKAPIDVLMVDKQVSYYQTHYKIEVDQPLSMEWKQYKNIHYSRVTLINDQWVHFHGKIGELKIDNLNSLFREVGIGNYGFLLGGQIDAIEN